jgi:hypothetical protein
MARDVRFVVFLALVVPAIACGEGSSEEPVGKDDAGEGPARDAGEDSGANAKPPKSGTGGKASSSAGKGGNAGKGSSAGEGGSAGGSGRAGGQAGGQAPVETPEHPELSQVSPPSAALDDEVVLRGSSFTPDAYVRLNAGDAHITTSFTDETELKFRVPRDYPLSKCEEAVEVTVEDSRGASSPRGLTVIQPSPSLALSQATIAAGTRVELEGRWLQDAALMLADQTVEATASYDKLRFDVPRMMPVGPARLLAQTRCGSATLDVQITPRPPQVLSIDPPGGASPGAVLYVTADFANRSAIGAVQLGKYVIAADDRARFAWPTYDYAEESQTFAVLMPPELPIADVELTVMGPNGLSAPTMVHGVEPSPRMGPSTNGIMYVPPGTGLAGAFPLGSGGAHGPVVLNRDAQVNSHWLYSIRIEHNETSTGACDSFGTITANERLCPDPCEPAAGEQFCPCEGYSDGSYCPAGTLVCHLITGTYELREEKNAIDVTIDRSSSGGTIEKYRGGWARVDEEPLTRGGEVLIVLRSERTGLPLTITHQLYPSCVH